MKKMNPLVFSFILNWETTHISYLHCSRHLRHSGPEFWKIWFWSSEFWICSHAGDSRRFCVVSYSQEARSWPRGGLMGLWPWVKLQNHAASPPWDRHSNLGQPPGQVPAQGPCAQCVITEDWEPDPRGQWAVPGSSQLHWRKRTYPGFPPHCLWWVTLLTPPYGFPLAFVLGVSHRTHFSWSLPDTSLHILFSLSELG